MKYKIIVALQLIMGTAFLTSCNDWLNISPRTEILKEDVFKEQNGYQDALTGVYIKMGSSSIYGSALTYGNIERLAQHWDESSGSHWATYNYVNDGIRSTFSSWYRNLYSVISDANNILAEIDKHQNVFEPGWYELIKGELLGIRAYCHLDILRLWGPIPGTTSVGNILPYVKTVSIIPHKHITYLKYIEELESDLNEAERLMEEWDPVISKEKMAEYGDIHNFWTSRQIRMNAYAVKALKARFYLWTQNNSLANKYAKEIIDSEKYKLGTSAKMNNTDCDYSFTSEHIFAMYYTTLGTVAKNSFSDQGGYGKSESILPQLFEGGAGTFDIRYLNLWEVFSLPNSTRFNTIKKYWQPASGALNQIPLIRLSEIYFIAMETGTLTEATELIAEFYPLRGLQGIEIVSPGQLKELMIKEYNREFYAEGQGFYAYKRLNSTDILWAGYEGSAEIYVLPMPDDEILN